jgi:hypothetical protein
MISGHRSGTVENAKTCETSRSAEDHVPGQAHGPSAMLMMAAVTMVYRLPRTMRMRP